ncbi:Alcohol dehydrogenase zinc-binding domain protein [Xylanimonas cellulosilytica DSM 15894]|uniref:Alcohol dehydrogenase zinc-binding domain protein n=1 Tax=Xylanimonas cellulosilytica (strain DSM 15894 / JCM 12276 / CECT 5975 / KCTC 9989 / LMG 20990 / NBRC 107835 / XIL07) TaxID=446471 RepID=D1BRS0_XYLCX|nr:zinc-dependent alcohol dehydrogenase family protein [Xylanimonas cellulosilytica]ACZ32336.1 Alcohol dehydrogenase zinc-binding domain protein [Xylanimonas cellulosilytica DSM 15894]
MSRVVVFDEFGGPEVLRVMDAPVVEPAAGEVRVRIEAFAVNPLDALMRSGRSPAPVPLPHARLGVEGTGVVEAMGADVAGLSVGAPVVLAAVPDAHVRGSYAEHVTLPARQVIPRPAGLGIAEAAAVWVAFSTAYGALVEKAGMRPGDHVVVTAASGAVGRAAVQVANRVGAVPLAVTRHAANADGLLDAGAVVVVAMDRENVVAAVRRHTGGTGADVVLDLVGGPGQADLARAVRPGGTVLAAGFLDPRPARVPTSPVPTTALPVVAYRSFEHTLDPAVVRRMAVFLDDGLREGALRPVVGEVFTLDDVVQAHRHLEKGLHGGRKIVVTP